MKLIKDFLTYTVGIAIVFIFAMSVLFVMWLKDKFCNKCKIN